MSVLDTEILNLEGNSWTTRDACTGVICFGMTGSGKSSGPLRSIALKFLSLGYGGIVFCAKPDECDTWLDYAKETGRSNDVIKLSEETFGFLDYEFSRPAAEGGGQVENVVNIFLEVVKISKDKKSGGTSDEYWQNAIKQFLRNTISLLVLAHEAVTLPNIKSTIDSALRSNEIAEVLKQYLDELASFLQYKENFRLPEQRTPEDCTSMLKKFDEDYKTRYGDKVSQDLLSVLNQYSVNLLRKIIYYGNDSGPDYELGFNYFLVEFPQLDERTRSNTISSFTVLADSMLRGEFLRCFGSRESSLCLEDLYRKGKILIVDQDVKRNGLVGQMTAAIVKLCFEKMIERREDISDPDARPVFLWADECQFFSLDYDQKFQTTARSSRTLTIYATQNLGNMYDGYGKEKATSLIGNLGSKFFCMNGDHETNKWAADSIGQEVVRRRSQNVGDSKSGGMKGDYNKSDNFTEGWSEQKDYKVDIISFTTLQAGGPRGQCQVGYIFWQSGRVFKNGDVFVKGTFKQKCRKVCGSRFERHCPRIPQSGRKEEYQGISLYWYDWLSLTIFIISACAVGGGLYLIYSERDVFLFEIPEYGIITAATIGLWFGAFAWDRFWSLIGLIGELGWLAFRRRKRHKCKTINRVPLIVFTWLYLMGSLALAILLQKAIYQQQPFHFLLLIWGASSIAHSLFKSAGGRQVPID